METTFIKLDFTLLFRNKLFHISAAVTIIYIGIFYLLKPLGSTHIPLIILIYNDPVIMGYMFAGVMWLFDKNQSTMQAISVLPVSKYQYLISKVLVLSLLALFLAIVMTISAVGFDFNPIPLILSTISSSLMFCCIGFTIGSISTHFLSFLMKSLPVFIVFALPVLVIVDLLPAWYFVLVPSLGALVVMKSSFIPMEITLLILGYLHMLFWTLLSIYICKRVVTPRIQ